MDVVELVALARAPAATADAVYDAVRSVLAIDVEVGMALALDLLAGEPRIKPSRSLTIDPRDDALRRWNHRVAAGAALLASPAAGRVRHELADELAADPELAADVRAWSDRSERVAGDLRSSGR